MNEAFIVLILVIISYAIIGKKTFDSINDLEIITWH